MHLSAVQKKVDQASTGLEEVARRVPYLKLSVSEVVEDGLHKARRAVKRSRYAAQDLMDDALYSVRRRANRGRDGGSGFWAWDVARAEVSSRLKPPFGEAA